MAVRIDSVNKAFGQGDGRVQVLRNISCSIEESEVCAVVGASGSGKSTFLNCLGGLDRPDSGSIIVDEEDITQLSRKKLARYRRRSIGFVFQFYNLVPNLTTQENIEVCQYLAHAPIPLDELLTDLGLTEHRHKFPSQLSGGQQQRCAVARALIKRPSLLLCDEPTGALDYETSREMLMLLEKVNQTTGTTIVIVTHNQAISQMAHRTLTMRDGTISGISMTQDPTPASELSW